MKKIKIDNIKNFNNIANIGDILQYESLRTWYKGVIISIAPLEIFIFSDKNNHAGRWFPKLNCTGYTVIKTNKCGD